VYGLLRLAVTSGTCACCRAWSCAASRDDDREDGVGLGEEVASADEADQYAFTAADVDEGWTGLRPGDLVLFTPSPTATLGKTPAVARARALAITLERPADEKRYEGFVVNLKDSFGFLKAVDVDSVRARLSRTHRARLTGMGARAGIFPRV
jgi:hypothetical protein